MMNKEGSMEPARRQLGWRNFAIIAVVSIVAGRGVLGLEFDDGRFFVLAMFVGFVYLLGFAAAKPATWRHEDREGE